MSPKSCTNSNNAHEDYQQFEALFEHMPSGVAIYSAVDNGSDFIFKNFNKSAEKIENMPKEDILGKRVSEVFPGIVKFGLFEVLQRVWKSGNSEFFPEHAYNDQRVSNKWRENWVYKLPSGDIVAIYNDVTDRKAMENELREKTSREVEAAIAGNVGVWDWDLINQKVRYSYQWKKQLGYADNEISENFHEFENRVHPDDLEYVRNEVSKSMKAKNQGHKIEFRMRHKNGTYRWIIAQASFDFDEKGRPIRMRGTHVDITDRKEAEEKALVNQKKFENAINALQDIFFILDLNGKITTCNTATENITGYTQEDIYQMRADDFFIDEDKPKVFEEIQRTIDNGYSSVYLTLLTKNKNKLPYHFSASRMCDKDNHIIGIAGIGRDISEIKHAEEIIKDTQAQLIQSEKLASLGQLSAGIAHEINNPLGFIDNNIFVLKEYIDKYTKIFELVNKIKEAVKANDINQAGKCISELEALEKSLNLEFISEDIHSLIEETKNGSERIKKIIQDLKTFSRKDEGQMELNNIEEILEGVLNIVWNEVKFAAEIEKDYQQLPQIICNAQKLGQVFINLLINAVHALDNKGKIFLRTYFAGKYACIEIEDTGCGIAQDDFNKIFDPFYTTKPVGTGTGLGLSISYDIIKQHNGEIRVASEVGKGTKFTIKLPLRESSQAADKSGTDT